MWHHSNSDDLSVVQVLCFYGGNICSSTQQKPAQTSCRDRSWPFKWAPVPVVIVIIIILQLQRCLQMLSVYCNSLLRGDKTSFAVDCCNFNNLLVPTISSDNWQPKTSFVCLERGAIQLNSVKLLFCQMDSYNQKHNKTWSCLFPKTTMGSCAWLILLKCISFAYFSSR